MHLYYNNLRDIPSSSCPITRSHVGIVWSCFSTMCLCGWSAIRPDAPTPSGWSRIKLMLLAVLLPEFIVAWAIRQWFAAREIQHTYNSALAVDGRTRWTMLHGYFFVMGGFSFVEQPSNRSLGVLSFNQFKTLIRSSNLQFPQHITEEYLRDRFQSSDTITILQLSWFIFQTLARSLQGLAITGLELITLAVVCMTAVARFFWFHKPLDVWQPILVEVINPDDALQLAQVPPNTISEHVAAAGSFSPSVVFACTVKVIRNITDAILVILGGLWNHGPSVALYGLFVALPFLLLLLSLTTLFSIFPLMSYLLIWFIKPSAIMREDSGLIKRFVTVYDSHRSHVTDPIIGLFARNLKDVSDCSLSSFLFWFLLSPATFLLLLLVFIPFLLFSIPMAMFRSIVDTTTSGYLTSPDTNVPTFYVPTARRNIFSIGTLFFFVVVIGGGLYSLGWNFLYPSPIELHLWRITSITITSFPLIVYPIFLTLTEFRPKRFAHGALLLEIMAIILILTYIVAKLAIYVLALELLRILPMNALLAVEWAKFFPHIG